jgi:hypothetical protein
VVYPGRYLGYTTSGISHHPLGYPEGCGISQGVVGYPKGAYFVTQGKGLKPYNGYIVYFTSYGPRALGLASRAEVIYDPRVMKGLSRSMVLAFGRVV